VQGLGLLEAGGPRALGADSAAVSAHKLHGPRGAGAPGCVRGPARAAVGRRWRERGLRGGSENPPALVGPGVAAPARAAPGGAGTPSPPADRSSKRRWRRSPRSSPAPARRCENARARPTSRRSRSPAFLPSRCCMRRGARRARVRRLRLRVANRRSEPDAQGDGGRPHGGAVSFRA
jgi:hypothetical protein